MTEEFSITHNPEKKNAFWELTIVKEQEGIVLSQFFNCSFKLFPQLDTKALHKVGETVQNTT